MSAKTHAVDRFDGVLESASRLDAGSLPRADNGVSRIDIAEELVSLLAPDSFAADQYRALRHEVELRRRESGLHVLAVTSPGPGDGKTVTTLNLAGALAQGVDARILVIDADLRRPKVADYLGLGAQHVPGLAELLRDPGSNLDRAVRRIDGSNLWILPAGAAQTSPYELLNAPRLEALLTEARRQYDCVLVDTPPIVAVPDGRLIAKWTDGFLLVVGAHKTPRKLVADALNLVNPARVIAVVFNGDNRPLHHYGYYGYYGADDRQTSWWRRALLSGRHRTAQRPS
jgi:capsular exopolysaccharide synthesis family protein